MKGKAYKVELAHGTLEVHLHGARPATLSVDGVEAVIDPSSPSVFSGPLRVKSFKEIAPRDLSLERLHPEDEKSKSHEAIPAVMCRTTSLGRVCIGGGCVFTSDGLFCAQPQ